VRQLACARVSGNFAVAIKYDNTVVIGSVSQYGTMSVRFASDNEDGVKILGDNNARTVVTPDGIRVGVRANFWSSQQTNYLNVEIYLPGTYMDQVQGLCGSFDESPNNDLDGLNGKAFGETQRVPKQERLLEGGTVPDISVPTTITYTPPDFKALVCNADGTEEEDEDEEDDKTEELEKQSDDDPFTGLEPLEDDVEDFEPQENDWASPEFKTEAEETCNNVFHTSDVAKYCKSIGIDTDALYGNCVFDAKQAGDLDFVAASEVALAEECKFVLEEKQKDGTLDDTPTDPDGPSVDVVEELLSCPGQCSGHGECTASGCVCNAGWSGDDCTLDDTAKPCIKSIVPATGQAQNGKVLVTGFHFRDDLPLTCHFGSSVSTGEYSSHYEMWCPIPSHNAGTVSLTVSDSRGSDPECDSIDFAFTLCPTSQYTLSRRSMLVHRGVAYRCYHGNCHKQTVVKAWDPFVMDSESVYSLVGAHGDRIYAIDVDKRIMISEDEGSSWTEDVNYHEWNQVCRSEDTSLAVTSTAVGENGDSDGDIAWIMTKSQTCTRQGPFRHCLPWECTCP
jgi:hypothetical protein